MNNDLICPCEVCAVRKFMSFEFVMDVYGETCPFFKCRKYERWEAENE